MTKTIKTTEATLKPLRDASPPAPRVDPDHVQQALGAEPTAAGFAGTLAPLTLFAVRAELARRLQSSGGRPGLFGVSRRAKIPLSDAQWSELEELAAAISAPGFAPTAGQVASVLLTLSLHTLAEQSASAPAVRELATAIAAESEGERVKRSG